MIFTPVSSLRICLPAPQEERRARREEEAFPAEAGRAVSGVRKKSFAGGA